MHRPILITVASGFLGAKLLGRCWRHPIVTPDQVLAFAQGTVGDPAPLAAELGRAPLTIEAGLRRLFNRSAWQTLGRPAMTKDLIGGR